MRRQALALDTRNRRKRLMKREPHREGFEFMGKWQTPEMIHRQCKEWMDWFDRLPKNERERIHEDEI